MTNDLLFFDTETTGIPDWKSPSDAPQQPHLVQLAALRVNPQTRVVVDQMDVIIRPNGWVIPDETIELHGITNAHADRVGVSERTAVSDFLDLWRGTTRVAHNTTFDNRMIRIATKRYFGEVVQDGWRQGAYECTGQLSKPIMKMKPKGRWGYKMPKLSEAYEYFFGCEFKNAHTAMADTIACMEVYFAIKDDEEGHRVNGSEGIGVLL